MLKEASTAFIFTWEGCFKHKCNEGAVFDTKRAELNNLARMIASGKNKGVNYETS
jgi:hypothetical protein